MTIQLTNEEKVTFFHTALCNIGGYLQGYGLNVNWDENEYKAAKAKLTSPCLEDVLIQILKDGGSIKIEDEEGEGENDATITMESLLANIETTPDKYLMDMYNEEDDVVTADSIIQSVAYREIIFG